MFSNSGKITLKECHNNYINKSTSTDNKTENIYCTFQRTGRNYKIDFNTIS